MSNRPSVFVTIVLDGVGIGEAPDAADYGDEGSDTLGHVLAACRPDLPNLTRLGLGNIRELPGVPATARPMASWGKMQERSAGKDSTTGHWELAGIQLKKPFPTYPDGFPGDLLDAFLARIGCRAVLGNRPESGTVIIQEYGARHLETGDPIVYTSADSVFQVAAHVDRIPLQTLYEWCRIAREEICVGPHAVGRVIARPFTGQVDAFERLSDKRHDYALVPPEEPVQAAVQRAGIRTVCVGKVADLFAGVGFTEVIKTNGNADGIAATIASMDTTEPTFIWTNLIDFDQEFGHRNNPEGFAGALKEFDRAIPDVLGALPDGGRLLITADHGNDPTTPSTDHAREFVPLLYVCGRSESLGIRQGFSDHAATVAHYFGVPYPVAGKSFEPV